MDTLFTAFVCLVFSYVRFCETQWTIARQAPCPWDSLGKNTGMGCHALLQENFPTRDQTPVSYVSCTGRLVLYHEHHPFGNQYPLSLYRNFLLSLPS